MALLWGVLEGCSSSNSTIVHLEVVKAIHVLTAQGAGFMFKKSTGRQTLAFTQRLVLSAKNNEKQFIPDVTSVWGCGFQGHRSPDSPDGCRRRARYRGTTYIWCQSQTLYVWNMEYMPAWTQFDMPDVFRYTEALNTCQILGRNCLAKFGSHPPAECTVIFCTILRPPRKL